MNIITSPRRAGSTAAPGRTAAKKDWELPDSLRETIVEYAREDAARNVYMGEKFSRLRKSEVAKVAPDRAALMGKIGPETDPSNLEALREAREGDRRMLCVLFGIPYQVEFQPEKAGSAIHIYDENQDEILTCTPGVGWHEKASRAENQVHGALKAVYFDAYHAARKEINRKAPAGGRGGFSGEA